MKSINVLRIAGISTILLACSSFSILPPTMAEENPTPKNPSGQESEQLSPTQIEFREAEERGWGEIWKKLEEGDSEGVLEAAEQIIKKDPNNADNYFYRGGLKKVLGDTQGYIEDVRKSIEMNPSDTGVRGNLAVFYYYEQKDYESAAKEYTGIINVNPNSPDSMGSYLMRGNIKWDRGDRQGALKDYAHMVRVAPSDPLGYMVSGRTLAQIGQMEEAKQSLESAVALNHPDDQSKAFVHGYVGRVYANRMNEPEEAKKHLEIALELYEKLNQEGRVGRLVEEIQRLDSSD